MELDGFLTGLAVGGALCWLAIKRRYDIDSPNHTEPVPTSEPAAIDPDPLSLDIFAQAKALEPRFEASAHPGDLLPDTDFQRVLSDSQRSGEGSRPDLLLGVRHLLPLNKRTTTQNSKTHGPR